MSHSNLSDYKIVDISMSFNGARLEKHNMAMLLQVERYIMKMALTHKVTRNTPDFNEANLRRD